MADRPVRCTDGALRMSGAFRGAELEFGLQLKQSALHQSYPIITDYLSSAISPVDPMDWTELMLVRGLRARLLRDVWW